MADRPHFTPIDEQELLAGITRDVLTTLPAGWVRLIVRARMIGTHSESSNGVKMADGAVVKWSFPQHIWDKFQSLRDGMYTQGLGTWVEFEYLLDPPGHYSIQYNRDHEPRFRTPPTAEDFALENTWFPRTLEFMPEWFQRGLATPA